MSGPVSSIRCAYLILTIYVLLSTIHKPSSGTVKIGLLPHNHPGATAGSTVASSPCGPSTLYNRFVASDGQTEESTFIMSSIFSTKPRRKSPRRRSLTAERQLWPGRNLVATPRVHRIRTFGRLSLSSLFLLTSLQVMFVRSQPAALEEQLSWYKCELADEYLSLPL